MSTIIIIHPMENTESLFIFTHDTIAIGCKQSPLSLSLSSYHSFSLRHYLCYEESEASTHVPVPTSYHFPSSHMNATHPQFPLFSCFCRLLSIAPHREENTHRCYLCMDVCNYYVQETVSARDSELWVGGVCLNE